jgi:phage anti-repressor protein
MNQIIEQKSINFNELVKNANTTLSINLETKMINILNTEFTEKEQQWYIANLYIYMNYHPTNDYPINLENVFKMIGFANKGNAMKTIKSNFTKDEDYKVTLLHTEKRKNEGGFNKEEVMLNIDTFKNLCMLAKTNKGKEIRKYYVKLENIYNKIIKEEIESQKLLLEEKNILLEEKENKHVLDKKLEKHDFLIDKFKNKKCVYIAEIKENLIKIGSTKDINERYKGLFGTFGNCIFLDIFEHVDYQTIESNILINLKPHLYKEPINNHISREVVQLSNIFNYKQLREIVIYYVNGTDFLSPLEILEKEKVKNETLKLNIIQELLSKGENLKDIIHLFSHNQNILIKKEEEQKEDEEEQKKEDEEKQQEDEKEQQVEDKGQQIHISKQILNSPVLLKGRKPKGQQIHKIDPNNLQNIIKTYDSMVYLLRSPECNGYNKSGILTAISDSRIYKGYRWNFINKETKATNEYKSSAPIRDAILKLNETKDLIIETFITKDEAAKSLGIGKLTMRNIIKNQEKHNTYYYIEYSKCPLHIIEKYDKPIFGINSIHAKKIKQINPITNTYIYFNNLNEIQLKLGITSKTIINSINDKTAYAGSFWEFA